MKKIDSKDKARTYGQNEKIWYLCMPYSFLNEEHTLDLDAEMGDRGLIIYFRLLMMATASQGVLKLDTRRISPLQRLAGRLQHRYTEDEIAQVLEILDENDMVKIIEGGEEIKFRDVYEMAVEKQRRAAEKRKAEGTAAYEGGETLEDEPEDEQEQPEEPEEPEQPEETEEERKKREKKEAAKQKKTEEKARIDEFFERLWAAYIPGHKDKKSNVKGPRRKELYELGEEKCLQALDTYKKCDRVRKGFILNASNFWNAEIDNILETAPAAKPQPQAPTEASIKTRLELDKVLSYRGVDYSKWDIVKGKYNEAEQAKAVEVMGKVEAR